MLIIGSDLLQRSDGDTLLSAAMRIADSASSVSPPGEWKVLNVLQKVSLNSQAQQVLSFHEGVFYWQILENHHIKISAKFSCDVLSRIYKDPDFCQLGQTRIHAHHTCKPYMHGCGLCVSIYYHCFEKGVLPSCCMLCVVR